MLMFEIAFVVYQAEIVSQCPVQDLPTVNAGNIALMTGGMMLVVLAGSVLTDATSLFVVATILSGLAIAIAISAKFLIKYQ